VVTPQAPFKFEPQITLIRRMASQVFGDIFICLTLSAFAHSIHHPTPERRFTSGASSPCTGNRTGLIVRRSVAGFDGVVATGGHETGENNDDSEDSVDNGNGIVHFRRYRRSSVVAFLKNILVTMDISSLR
jgi:hypothetical protein